MRDSEVEAFARALSATMEVYGSVLSKDAVSIWWSVLSEYDFGDVRSALSAHIKDPERGRYPPKPADVIAKIPSGHPSPEEAWAMVHSAIGDERATVVLTEEMRNAFFAADAIPGDKIAARMVFLEVYKREVSRSSPKPVWTVIQGWDEKGRVDAIEQAAGMNRISQEMADKLIGHKKEVPIHALLRLQELQLRDI